MKLYSQTKNLKAFGLLESLVGIAVFGTSILIALGLVVNSLNVIQDNNLEDQASSIMINSLEYVKSPSSLLVLSEGLYSLNYSMNNGYVGVVEKSSEISENCSVNSEYYIENENGLPFCNSIKVEYLDGIDGGTFLITSKVVYKNSKGFSSREISGIRKR